MRWAYKDIAALKHRVIENKLRALFIYQHTNLGAFSEHDVEHSGLKSIKWF